MDVIKEEKIEDENEQNEKGKQLEASTKDKTNLASKYY